MKKKSFLFLGSKVQLASKADNLTANCLDNVRSSTSHNTIGLHSLLQEWLYFTFTYVAAAQLLFLALTNQHWAIWLFSIYGCEQYPWQNIQELNRLVHVDHASIALALNSYADALFAIWCYVFI
jgi:hypothetical protein